MGAQIEAHDSGAHLIMPESFILPYDYNEIKTFLKKSQKTLILKPEGSCQGRGIFLIRDPEDIPMDKYVV